MLLRSDNHCLRRTLPALLCMMFVCLSSCGDDKNAYTPPPPPEVTVAKPVQKTITNYLEFTGTTKAAEIVDIRARVEGYLQSIHFTPSQMVKKGQLLFVIDPRPYMAKLDEAKAALSVQKAALKLAEATLARKQSAFQARAVSEVEVLVAEAEKDQAAAAVEAAFATMETARLNMDYTTIRSPINGRINRSLVDVGNLVRSGEATLLATVVNFDPVYAYFNISELDLLSILENIQRYKNDIRQGPKFPAFLGLANDAGYPFEGEIDFIENTVDPDTGTIQVRAVFPNANQAVLPGLFARIRLPARQIENALLISERALGADQRGRYLLVVDQENTVEYRTVKIGALVDGMRVILSGISADDTVIVNGIQRARPGQKVKPVPADTKDTKTES